MKRLCGQYQIKSRQNITYIFYFIRKALTWISEEPGSRTRVFPRWAGDLGDLTGSACFSWDTMITVQGPALKHTQANLWAFVYFNKLCSLRYTCTFITVLISRVFIHMDSMCCTCLLSCVIKSVLWQDVNKQTYCLTRAPREQQQTQRPSSFCQTNQRELTRQTFHF